MEALYTFANEIGFVLAALIVPLCYLGSIWVFFLSVSGFLRQAKPDNPYRGRPWVPFVLLLMSGGLASFDTLLTKANVSFGSSVVVRMSPLVSYTPVGNTADLMGANPGEFIVNVVELFWGFFAAFGAMACLSAYWSRVAAVTGRSNASGSSAVIKALFGIALINSVKVSEWLVSIFIA